jgi:hypothetical protein
MLGELREAEFQIGTNRFMRLTGLAQDEEPRGARAVKREAEEDWGKRRET